MRKSILITKFQVLCSYIQHEYAGITNVYNTIKFLIYYQIELSFWGEINRCFSDNESDDSGPKLNQNRRNTNIHNSGRRGAWAAV